jgi:nucleoside-diphosphate-sugar epimerase
MSKVVDLVMKHTKSTSEIKILDSEPHTTHTKIVDNKLAKLELNHSDTVTLDEGIYQTVNWMKSRINQNL